MSDLASVPPRVAFSMHFRCLHEHPSIFMLLLRGLLPSAPPAEAWGTAPSAPQGNLSSCRFAAHGANQQLGSSFYLPTRDRGFSCCKPQLKGRALSQLLGSTNVVNGEPWQLSLSPVALPGGGLVSVAVTHRCPWPLTPALPTWVLSLRGDALSTHNSSSHLLKTPVLHVSCLLEGKQSLTFQGRKGKAARDAGHSEHGLLGCQQCRAVGSITTEWGRRESRGALSRLVLLEQGRGVVGISGTWSSCQAHATLGLLL